MFPASKSKGHEDLGALTALISSCAEPLPEPDDPSFGLLFDRFANNRIVLLGEARLFTIHSILNFANDSVVGCISFMFFGLIQICMSILFFRSKSKGKINLFIFNRHFTSINYNLNRPLRFTFSKKIFEKILNL